MKAIVKVAGGESEEFTECVTPGSFQAGNCNWMACTAILGLSVVF